MNNIDLLNWAKGHCRELWQLNDDHITIDVCIVDGEHLSFQLHHEALGSTGWCDSIEDAKRLLASKININSVVEHSKSHYQNEALETAETTGNPF